MLNDLKIILWAEQLQHHHPTLRAILRSIWWKDVAIVRLPLLLNELEEARGDGAATSTLIQGLTETMPDEKCAEDLHQYCRDESRSRRSPGLTTTRLMRANIECELPQKRKMPTIDLPTEELAERIVSRPKAIKHKFRTPTDHWPSDLNSLTSRVRSWTTPSQQGYYEATAAWSWLRCWYQHCRSGGQGEVATNFACCGDEAVEVHYEDGSSA